MNMSVYITIIICAVSEYITIHFCTDVYIRLINTYIASTMVPITVNAD